MSIKSSLAWLQLIREKSRFMIALAGVAFSNILIFMQLGFEGALYDSNTRLHKSLNADLIMISPRSTSLAYLGQFSRRRLYQTLGFEGVQSVNSLYVEYAFWKNPKSGDYRPILVFGIDPEQVVFNLPEVNQNLDKIKIPHHALFDRNSRPEYGVIKDAQNHKVIVTEVSNYQVKVVGLFSLGPSFAADGNLITSDLNFQNLLKSYRNHDIERINIGLIKLHPNYDMEQVLHNLVNKLPQDVKILTRQGFIEFEKNYWRNSTPIGFMFRLGTIVGFVVGTVIVYQIINADVSDHLPEYATLKAMGYTHRYLLVIVFQESIILALLGYIPGIGISLTLYQLAKSATLLPMLMTVSRALTVLFLTIIMCLISGMIATRKLQEADPSDIF